jgi:signal transduction histidine kinase
MKSFDLRLSHKVLILVSVPIVLMLVFVATLAALQKQAEDEIWRERHSKAVIAECNSLMHNFMDAGMFLFLYEETHQRSFLKSYQSMSQQIPVQINSLKVMLRDSPNSEDSLEQLDKVGGSAVQLLRKADQVIDSKIEGGGSKSSSHAEFVQTSTEMLSCLRKFIDEQQDVERTNPKNEARLRLWISQWLCAGVLLSILLAVALAVFFNRATTNRLLVLVDNTYRLAAGKELRDKLSGNDEIAHLDGVFHDMAFALKETSRRKQELVQMVTHDLRTPLTSINAALKIMSSGISGPLPDKAFKQVGIAERSSDKLLNLVNDLLDIERMETGNFALELQRASAQQIVDAAADSVRALLSARGIKLVVGETDLWVQADPRRIEQVLINLLSNAAKFSADHARVELQVSAADDQVEFKVIDQGRGVPAEFQTAIFERFAQVKMADSVRGKGTGLGLPICKAIVEAHGGTIAMTSRDGEGSIFWFRIKQAKPEEK